ncbi:hypothetical protein F5887DRAFT_500120 [Amanita rubescens]|nr:hypothetical protein F5887DRAFT_500120 [Amanita rubescens]
MPPPDLPGFYWDSLKNRYFPISSRPAVLPEQPVHIDSAEPHTPPTNEKQKCRDAWALFQVQRQSHDVNQRDRMAKEILSSHYASTSLFKHTWIPTSGRIRAFCTTNYNGFHRRYLGDDQGWLYACMTPDIEEQDIVTESWLPELILHPASEITSICISGTKCVATCLGPSARISVQDLNVIGTSLLGLKGVHDIWCAHLDGSSLAIGADKRAIFLQDLDSSAQFKYLETQSDVFSVYHRHNLVYTGARNGSITRFDQRLKTYGQKLYDNRFGSGARSTVLHLEVVRDYQLLTSHMDGNLASYDLRFTRHSSPLVRYAGHVNTHHRKLGIAVDPHEQFLFAAGVDRRIRSWSLSTGAQIQPPAFDAVPESMDTVLTPDDAHRLGNPFKGVFSHPVQAMQVTEERRGLCLWAASDEDLYQYHLGQQGDCKA